MENMNEKPKRKLGWRLLRWGLIGLAVLVTLAAVLVTEENWRGKRAWEEYKRESAAHGERLDMASVIPQAVPDDQNFFCTPIASRTLLANLHQPLVYVTPATLAKRIANTNHSAEVATVDESLFTIYRGDANLWPTDGGNWSKGTFADLKQWQQYFRDFAATPEGKTNGFPVSPQPQSPAEDVLLALSVYDPVVKELREALQRPQARLPLNYEDGFEVAGELLPFLANVKRCGQFFQLRAFANLGAGHGAAALADIKTLLNVNDTLRSQPFLISTLVHMAMFSIALQPIYEGLARHCWTDAELAELENSLARQDYLADFQFALRSEKVLAMDAIEKQRISRKIQTYQEADGTNRPVTISLRWTPAAYFYQSQVCIAQINDQIRSTLIDVTNRIVSPEALRRFDADIQARMKSWSPYRVQGLMMAPALAKAVQKFAIVQAELDQARVACALERYRLAHGQYPETLDGLAPHFIGQLPHDIINGEPLHYRRVENDKFVLYSVGWNETDDGGETAFRKAGAVDREKGDWVWQYPAK
jgi:hypothetical protein